MPTIPQTELHRVYLAERWGDTMVVIPRGDAVGFSVTAVNVEIATIKGLAETGTTRHLVVDLAGGNYFGSIVLGALIELGTIVRDRGGRIALCGASNDMLDVLRLMKLDRMWEIFPDREQALRKIAAIPMSERLWARRRSLLWLATIAIVAGVIAFLPEPQYGRSQYRELAELWQEVESRRGQAGVEEWARLEHKCRNRLERIVSELKAIGDRRALVGAEPFVLYAARDYWLPSMRRGGNHEETEEYRQLVIYNFRCAEARLAKRPLPYRALADDGVIPAAHDGPPPPSIRVPTFTGSDTGFAPVEK